MKVVVAPKCNKLWSLDLSYMYVERQLIPVMCICGGWHLLSQATPFAEKVGPAFGYYPNAMKTWLIVKQHHLDEANDQFKDSGISITTEGKRHLGAAISTPQFISVYVERKVCEWVSEIERLLSIALTQPHAAYAALTDGLKHKWTYLIRTIPAWHWKSPSATGRRNKAQVLTISDRSNCTEQWHQRPFGTTSSAWRTRNHQPNQKQQILPPIFKTHHCTPHLSHLWAVTYIPPRR